MKINKIFGFILALTVSSQAMAYEQDDSPPFNSFICVADSANIQVQVQAHNNSQGTGPAKIRSSDADFDGQWRWQPTELRTRLTRYHHLTVNAKDQNGLTSFALHTLYSPYGQLSGGWIEMSDYAGAVNCQIAKKPQTTHQCKVSPQNDCSTSPKRLCCDCENGHLSCY